eukprot:2491375-Pyramimonas_sp.AAC.1
MSRPLQIGCSKCCQAAKAGSSLALGQGGLSAQEFQKYRKGPNEWSTMRSAELGRKRRKGCGDKEQWRL